MQVELVLTAIAKDRPGLVEKLAALIAGHSGNWIDSAMAKLGGEFAGILRVAVPDTEAAALQTALAGLKAEGITVTVRTDIAPEPATGRHAVLELIGQGQLARHPGLP